MSKPARERDATTLRGDMPLSKGKVRRSGFALALGRYVRQRREAMGLNAAGFGGRWGFGGSAASCTVVRVERGERCVTVDELVALGDLLGMPADDLLGEVYDLIALEAKLDAVRAAHASEP